LEGTSVRVPATARAQEWWAPVVNPEFEHYELLGDLGYLGRRKDVTRANVTETDCNRPVLIQSNTLFTSGIPYLNRRARRMYESLAREGWFREHSE
jgi:hypothetical protein